MLEDREEVAYADLRRYYQFDLGAWLSGECHDSVGALIAMLSALPKNSAFMAHYTAWVNKGREDDEDNDEPLEEPTEEELYEQEILERQEWGHTDLHIATAINSINGMWASYVNSHIEKEDDKFFPSPVGPDFMLTKDEAEKRRKKQIEEARKAKKKSGEKAASVMGFYSMLGAIAPGGAPDQ